MITDNSKLHFSSTWEIDQLVDSNTVTISGSGDTALVDFSSLNLPTIPIFEVQFQPTGSTKWFESGENSTNGTLAGLFVHYAFISGSTLTINTGGAGTARYYLWSDKVDHA